MGDRSMGGWVFTTVGGELFVPFTVPSLKAERMAEDFCNRCGWPSPSTQRFVLPVEQPRPPPRRYRPRTKPG